MNGGANAATHDDAVVRGFGDEWTRFDQEQRTEADLRETFEAYFAVFPWEALTKDAVGIDVGCGSGRWARFVAGRAGSLTCVDASPEALEVARRNLNGIPNVEVREGIAGQLPFAAGSFDFAYSLGVLHHVPDTAAAVRDVVRVTRPGGPVLLYLYYALDNRPAWFRVIWRGTDAFRRIISKLPHPLRYAVSQCIAIGVYWPLARLARLAERLGLPADRFPLASYRTKPVYVMRTDALDRFGTRIEHRFTKIGMRQLMEQAGLENVLFSDRAPYWCAVGFKKTADDSS